MKVEKPGLVENVTAPLPFGDRLLLDDLGSGGGTGDEYLIDCEMPPVVTATLPAVEFALTL